MEGEEFDVVEVAIVVLDYWEVVVRIYIGVVMFWEVFGVGYYFVVLYVLSVLLVFGCYIYLVFVEGVVVDDWVGGVVVDIGYWGEVNVDVG